MLDFNFSPLISLQCFISVRMKRKTQRKNKKTLIFCLLPLHCVGFLSRQMFLSLFLVIFFSSIFTTPFFCFQFVFGKFFHCLLAQWKEGFRTDNDFGCCCCCCCSYSRTQLFTISDFSKQWPYDEISSHYSFFLSSECPALKNATICHFTLAHFVVYPIFVVRLLDRNS